MPAFFFLLSLLFRLCCLTYSPTQWDQTFHQGSQTLVKSIHLAEPMLIQLCEHRNQVALANLPTLTPTGTKMSHIWDLTYLQVAQVLFCLETPWNNKASFWLFAVVTLIDRFSSCLNKVSAKSAGQCLELHLYGSFGRIKGQVTPSVTCCLTA